MFRHMAQPPSRDWEFYDKYLTAVTHAQAGRWLQSADDYLEAYMMPTAAGWEVYWDSWSGFTSIIRDRQFPATESHMKALKRVAKDKAYPVLHRAQAFLARGLARWDAGNRQEAARDYLSCIATVTQATAAERAVRCYNTSEYDCNTISRVQQTAGDSLDDVRVTAQSNLDSLRRGSKEHHVRQAAAQTALRGTQQQLVRLNQGYIGLNPSPS
jgi:hypothetical protein